MFAFRLLQQALFFLLLIMSATTHADTAIEQLHAFYSEVRTYQANFTQEVRDPKGSVLQQGAGQLYLQRPGRFRWDYNQPYEQLILADGEKVWIYDADLEQVTVKRIDAAMGETPAVLLSGDRPLEERFELREVETIDGSAWVELLPNKGDSSFELMRLEFAKNDLRSMIMLDNFGQTTLVQFAEVKRNPRLDPALFRFQPPEGVDVVGDVD